MVTRLREKDRVALDYLYDRYSAALFGVVSRIIRHREIAEEVLQDAFIKIWDKIESYDAGKGRLFTWMLNITRNLAIDKLRSKEIGKENKTGGIENFVSRIDMQIPVELKVDDIGVRELLTSLPDDQRFVVESLYFRGYTQAELAEESGIALGTIKTRLRLAMNQLRIKLEIA